MLNIVQEFSMISYQGDRIGKEKVKNSTIFGFIFRQIIAIFLYLFTSQLRIVRVSLNLLIAPLENCLTNPVDSKYTAKAYF